MKDYWRFALNIDFFYFTALHVLIFANALMSDILFAKAHNILKIALFVIGIVFLALRACPLLIFRIYQNFQESQLATLIDF